jgi:hypothetical protein
MRPWSRFHGFAFCLLAIGRTFFLFPRLCLLQWGFGWTRIFWEMFSLSPTVKRWGEFTSLSFTLFTFLMNWLMER